MTSSAVTTPTSIFCSSTTGSISRLYLSNSSATSSSLVSMWQETSGSLTNESSGCVDDAKTRLASGTDPTRVPCESVRKMVLTAAVPPSKVLSKATARSTVALNSTWRYSVVIRPAAVSSSNSRRSRISCRPAGSISCKIRSECSSERSPSRSAAASGFISSTMSAMRSESSDSTIFFLSLGSISSSASAAMSWSRVSNTASRSSGARSSTMSAISAGCRSAKRALEIFSLTRRAGSDSIKSTNSHGIERCGMRFSKVRSAALGTAPFRRRRTAPRAPTSTEEIFKICCSPTVSPYRSTSLTRTTLRP